MKIRLLLFLQVLCFSFCLGQTSFDSLFSRAEAYYQASAFDSSLLYYHRALRQSEGSRDSLTACAGMALPFFKLQQIDSAQYYLSLGLASGGQAPALRATARHRLGLGLMYRQQLDQALDTMAAALAVRQRLLPPDHEDLAESYHGFSLIYYYKGDYAQAVDYTHRTLVIWEKHLGPDHAKVASGYNNLSVFYHELGDYVQEQVCLERTRSILEGMDPPDELGLINLYINLGNFLLRKGDFEQALAFQKRAIPLIRQRLGPDHPHLALAYVNTGACYSEKEDYETALLYYQKAQDLQVASLGEWHPDVAASHLNMGVSYDGRQQFAQSIYHYEKALQIQRRNYGEVSPLIARTYNNLGTAYLNVGDRKKAISFYQKALDILLKTLGAGDRLTALTYSNLASGHQELANYPQAWKYIRQSLASWKALWGELHPEVAEAYYRMARLSALEQKWPQSLVYLDSALHAVDPGWQETKEWTSRQNNVFPLLLKIFGLQGEARLQCAATGRESEALLHKAQQSFQLSLGLVDTLRLNFREPAARLLLSQQAFPLYEKAIHTQMRLHGINRKREYWEQAFHYAEKYRSFRLREALQESEALAFAGIPDSLLAKERELRLDLTFFEKQVAEAESYADPADSTRLRRWQAQLFDLKQAYQALIRQFESQYPEYYRLKYRMEVMSAAELQKKLTGEQAFLEYFCGEEEMYLFVLRRDSFAVFHWPQDDSLEERVRALRSHLETFDAEAFVDPAWQLYQYLLAKAVPILDRPQWVIVPDGPLHYLPFETLLSAPPGQKGWQQDYLVYHHRMSYSPAATLWANDAPVFRHGQGEALLGFAPGFSEEMKAAYRQAVPAARQDSHYLSLLRQPATVRGLERLLQILPGNGYFGAEAQESVLKREAIRCRILHLGTHAEVNDRAPLLSRFALAKPLDPDTLTAEDGYLHTYEIYNLETAAELAVLTACQTGIGRWQRGEGLQSLAQAFSYAGCPSMLMSLWSIDEQQSARLVQAFYEGLNAGLSKDQALHQAKIDFLKSAQGELANPYYWSGLILMGDTRPLPLSRPVDWPYILILILVLLALVGWIWKRKGEGSGVS